jgi:hypothetical protein
LKLDGGTFNTIVYIPTGRDSGILGYDDLTIIFTGLEPVYVSRLARALQVGGMIDRTADPRDPRAVELPAWIFRRGDGCGRELQACNFDHGCPVRG